MAGGVRPMDIDPIDDGPKEVAPRGGMVPMTPDGAMSVPVAPVSKEEEARQAIDMLRGDDVSQRVAAASRLESVATVLGEERTRNVSSLLRWITFIGLLSLRRRRTLF